jgi:hypothetical protein
LFIAFYSSLEDAVAWKKVRSPALPSMNS